jgi:hypothetical protein
MKKIAKNRFTVLLAVFMALPLACKESFLDVPVTGQLQEEQVLNEKGMEGLLLGVYSVLNGRGNGWHSGASNWLWGSIRAGEANKGTNAGDFNAMNPIERFELNATNGEVQGKWLGCYEGIGRANYLLYKLQDPGIIELVDEAVRNRIEGETKFLRGHYYFELRKNFKMVPFVDETTNQPSAQADKEVTDKRAIPNNTDVFPQIEADFTDAIALLPETQTQVGRANSWAAKAYLAKVLMQEGKVLQARDILRDVVANGKTSDGKKYGLLPRFDDVFRGEMENHQESVFAFQAAAGTGDVNNTNQDLAMNYPYNTGPSGPGECCGFFAPSFDLINSYRVDAAGIPLHVNHAYRDENNEIKSDYDVASNVGFEPDTKPMDPRLDMTIGRRYVQFLDWIPHPGKDWIRDQGYAGPYTQKKYSYRKSDKGKYQDGSSWTPGYHSINFMILRYADILLLAAEAEIEQGDLNVGIGYINDIRTRAANTAAFVKGSYTGNFEKDDKGANDFKKPILNFNQNAGDYHVGTYGALSQAEAREAVRFERKLELALEGQRFYDLIRWGIDVEEINSYLDYEGDKLPTHLGGATYVADDAYLPIPQRQIDLQGPAVLTQNKGY